MGTDVHGTVFFGVILPSDLDPTVFETMLDEVENAESELAVVHAGDSKCDGEVGGIKGIAIEVSKYETWQRVPLSLSDLMSDVTNDHYHLSTNIIDWIRTLYDFCKRHNVDKDVVADWYLTAYYSG
jgi:hypothetical protein